MSSADRPSFGLAALSAFFGAGALIAGTTAVALLTPGGLLDPLWRLNPRAQVAFLAMGPWAVVLMIAVSAACALAAIGLRVRAQWGRRLAVVLLAVNALGGVTNAVVRGDVRGLVGLPIAGLLLAYLMNIRVRRLFDSPPVS